MVPALQRSSKEGLDSSHVLTHGYKADTLTMNNYFFLITRKSNVRCYTQKKLPERSHALQDKISENRRELRELDAVADGIKDPTGVRFVNSLELPKARLETIGIIAEEFGDSKSKVNAEAGKSAGFSRRLNERWVHKGAFVLEFKKALHKVGFTKVQAYPHAKEGDPSERIDELIKKKEGENMIAEERDLDHYVLL